MDKNIIYVAGNPGAYPVEYYNPETASFEGLIPRLLKEFSARTGYDVRYYRAGVTDERETLAKNLQVDLISGCVGAEEFVHRSELTLLTAETGEGACTYRILLSETAPEGLAGELQDFLSSVTQQRKTGMLLESAQLERGISKAELRPLFGGLLLLSLLLGTVVAVLARKYRRVKKSLEREEETDALTGIGNSIYLERCYRKFIEDKNRILYTLFYFFVNTEEIERTGGRALTESFLRHTAAVLLGETGERDILARVADGGFVLLRLSPAERELLPWLRSVLTRIREFEGGKCGATAGIYRLHRGDWEIDEVLINTAEAARSAYRAEEEYRFCTGELLRIFEEERALQADLHRALEREEFQLYIQFYVELKSGKIAGGEALSRWEHPECGLLSPAQFLPLMEKEGLISRLDYFALDKGCGFLAELEKAGLPNFFLSCNFSAETLREEQFLATCEEIIGKHQFDRQNLVFEFPKEAAAERKRLQVVEALGVKIALDLGEGTLSLFEEETQRVDILKLGRPLVRTLETGGGALLRALIQAGHELGWSLFAVGVEVENEMAQLQAMGCDMAQGFHFHQPLPAWEAEKLLAGQFLAER